MKKLIPLVLIFFVLIFFQLFISENEKKNVKNSKNKYCKELNYNNHNLNISVIDISSKAIEIINNKFKTINTFCEDFFVFADSRISNNEKFDIIYSNGTHEHFRDLEKSLKLTKQLLSKNGFFLMAVPNNLGYDINKDQQVEGFRELNGGSRQMEWHLFLSSWKKIIYNSGFKFTFFRGFDERIGFIFYMYT